MGLFGLLLVGALVFTLIPNRHGTRGYRIPLEIHNWCSANDEAANFGAFGFLGAWILNPIVMRRPGAVWKCAALLAFLVFLIEAIQTQIPGRIFDWMDVVAGIGGILAATGFYFIYEIIFEA
jgi:hypothetical protein